MLLQKALKTTNAIAMAVQFHLFIHLFLFIYCSPKEGQTFACKYIAVLIISETIKKVLDSKQELGLPHTLINTVSIRKILVNF